MVSNDYPNFNNPNGNTSAFIFFHQFSSCFLEPELEIQTIISYEWTIRFHFYRPIHTNLINYRGLYIFKLYNAWTLQLCLGLGFSSYVYIYTCTVGVGTWIS